MQSSKFQSLSVVISSNPGFLPFYKYRIISLISIIAEFVYTLLYITVTVSMVIPGNTRGIALYEFPLK